MAALVQTHCAKESSAQVQCRSLLPILHSANDEDLVLALVELCQARQHLLGAVVAALAVASAAVENSAAASIVSEGAANRSAGHFIGDVAAQQDAESGSDKGAAGWAAEPSKDAGEGCCSSRTQSSTNTRASWASESSEGAAGSHGSSCGVSDEQSRYHEQVDWVRWVDKMQLDFKPVQGVLYPHFYNREEIDRLRDRWEPRRGDVILTASWPLRGLKRMLTAIVEGRVDDPYGEGFNDKPRLLDFHASRYGCEDVLHYWSDWPSRRVLDTLALPHELPFAWPPSEQDVLAGMAPKIVVIVADPRYAMALLWEMLSSFKTLNLPLRQDSSPALADFVEALVENHFSFFADPFKHSMAWAQEAMKWPDHVKLMRLERFASQDPREVSATCAEFAEIVGVKEPETSATRLLTAVNRRPRWAAQSLAKDCYPDPEAVRGGPLVELVGPRIQEFEASLASLRFDTKAAYRKILFRMMDNPMLVDVAGRAINGVSTVPPLKEFSPFKGEAAHEAGTCRMCVFALRGACRNTPEMCPFCHLPGHAQPKRPSKHKRAVNKRNAAQTRCRTPSVDGLSS